MKKTLAENYRRLFNGRASSNDKKLISEAMSSSKKREMIEVVQSIYQNANDGYDQTDDIIDELGDFYNAVYRSKDDELIAAYDMLRQQSDEDVEEQAKAAANLLNVLGVN
jgi:replicative DNA helicase